MRWVHPVIAGQDEFFWLRVVGGSTAISLAVVWAAVNGIDEAFLILVGVAAVAVAVPWHRLSGFRAGPLEFSLEHEQVRGAVDSISVAGDEKERLTTTISRLAPDIERAQGSRVLWIDDRPLRVVGERRLFRALGIETVTVTSSRNAVHALERDNDFDLVITSLERAREKRMVGDDPRYPGVIFVRWLRGEMDDSVAKLTQQDAPKDPVIRNLAVIFYAAFPMSDLREKTHPATELEPGAELSNSLDDLLKKVVRLLADVRSHPIEVPPSKKVY